MNKKNTINLRRRSRHIQSQMRFFGSPKFYKKFQEGSWSIFRSRV